MTVVQFPKPQNHGIANDPNPPDVQRVFVCDCGCYSFTLCADGTIMCASCEEIMETDMHQPGGAWWQAIENAPTLDTADAPPMSTILGDGEEFQRRRISQIAAGSDWLLCGTFDGNVTAWIHGPVLNETQVAWLRRRVENAMEMVEVDADG
jgi:hypothetical protein